jgi:hypothetical protein
MPVCGTAAHSCAIILDVRIVKNASVTTALGLMANIAAITVNQGLTPVHFSA